MKTRVKQLKDDEKVVTLMMDEIYLKPHFDYKAGAAVGSSMNSADPAKTAHVFMVQSLLLSNKDVAHILPASSIKGEELHRFLKKLIAHLEKDWFHGDCCCN